MPPLWNKGRKAPARARVVSPHQRQVLTICLPPICFVVVVYRVFYSLFMDSFLAKQGTTHRLCRAARGTVACPPRGGAAPPVGVGVGQVTKRFGRGFEVESGTVGTFLRRGVNPASDLLTENKPEGQKWNTLPGWAPARNSSHIPKMMRAHPCVVIFLLDRLPCLSASTLGWSPVHVYTKRVCQTPYAVWGGDPRTPAVYLYSDLVWWRSWLQVQKGAQCHRIKGRPVEPQEGSIGVLG